VDFWVVQPVSSGVSKSIRSLDIYIFLVLLPLLARSPRGYLRIVRRYLAATLEELDLEGIFTSKIQRQYALPTPGPIAKN
jgi:hypothetical protein